MTKQIKIEKPLDCPYRVHQLSTTIEGETCDYTMPVDRYECSKFNCGCANPDEFPEKCRLIDAYKAYKPEIIADYIMWHNGTDQGYNVTFDDVYEEFSCDLMYELAADAAEEIYEIIKRKQNNHRVSNSIERPETDDMRGSHVL